MPEWVPRKPKLGKVQEIAQAVAARVHCMQAGLSRRAKAHKEKGQRSARWVQEREANRPWLQHVLRAWAAAKGRTGTAAGAVAGARRSGGRRWGRRRCGGRRCDGGRCDGRGWGDRRCGNRRCGDRRCGDRRCGCRRCTR